jgi:hypothetical protein
MDCWVLAGWRADLLVVWLACNARWLLVCVWGLAGWLGLSDGWLRLLACCAGWFLEGWLVFWLDGLVGCWFPGLLACWFAVLLTGWMAEFEFWLVGLSL